MKRFVIILILLIFVFSCTNKVAQNQTNQENKTIQKDEFFELKVLVYNEGWDTFEENVSGKVINNFKFETNIFDKCTREVYRKGDLGPHNETINPFIRVIFEKRWTQEELNREKEQRDKCIEQITKHPEKATGCPNLAPHINTEKYSIFIYSDDCKGESKELKQKIKELLSSS